MANRRGTKYTLRISGLNEPRQITSAQWQDFLTRRLIRQVGRHLAVLVEGVIAFTTDDGRFELEYAPTSYIRNSWKAWDAAWLFTVGKMPAHIALMGLFARQEYAMRERQSAIDEDATIWQWKRRGRAEIDAKPVK